MLDFPNPSTAEKRFKWGLFLVHSTALIQIPMLVDFITVHMKGRGSFLVHSLATILLNQQSSNGWHKESQKDHILTGAVLLICTVNIVSKPANLGCLHVKADHLNHVSLLFYFGSLSCWCLPEVNCTQLSWLVQVWCFSLIPR